MAELRLELGEPTHGWITVALTVDGQRWEGVASYVLEGLTDLVCAGLELLEGLPVRPVIFHEEPTASRIQFVRDGARVEVCVSHHDDHGDARRGGPGTVVLAATVDGHALARAIWAGFRRLQGTLSDERIASGWMTTFPAREVAQLGEALRARGAARP